MRLELGRRPVRATIKPRGETLGHVTHRPTHLDVDYFDPLDWRLSRWAQMEIMVSLAGPEAERRLTGRCTTMLARRLITGGLQRSLCALSRVTAATPTSSG